MLLAPLAPNGAFKFYLYARDVDMRKSFDGLTIWMKRLECGAYERSVRPSADGAHLEIDAADLALLLAGVEFQSARRRTTRRRRLWPSPRQLAAPLALEDANSRARGGSGV